MSFYFIDRVKHVSVYLSVHVQVLKLGVVIRIWIMVLLHVMMRPIAANLS